MQNAREKSNRLQYSAKLEDSFGRRLISGRKGAESKERESKMDRAFERYRHPR